MVIHKKKYLAIFLAAMVSSIIAVGQAAAQETSSEKEVTALRGNDFSLEEIIVTARRRDETLSTTPIAIDVLSAATLREKGVTTLEEVANLSPGLAFEVGVLPNDTRPVIRGLNITRGRPNVGILVDGIDVSSETLTVSGGGTSANLELMDLERVEVVKGPQSALYGRSAFGGAVNYVTARPDGESGGKFGVDFDEHGYQKFNLSGKAGLTENLAASINLTTSDFDGYYSNPNTGGDLGGIETDGIAIAFNYTPNETFSAYLRGEFSEEAYTPRAVALKTSLSPISARTDFFLSGSVGEGGQLVPIPGGAFGGRIPQSSAATCATATPFAYTVGGRTACATMLIGDQGSGIDESLIDQSPNPETGKDFDGTEIENSRISLELAWDLGGVNVVSLTGVSSNETSISEDFDLTNFELSSFGPGSANFDPSYVFANPFGSPPDFTPLGNNPGAAFTQVGANTNSDTTFDSNQFSQEIRISGDSASDRVHWLVSLQYWKEDMDAVMNQMWWVRESADIDYWNSAFSRFADPTCRQPGNVTTCALFTGAATGPQPLRIPMSRNTEHVSIAGSLTFDISDNQRLTVEARYLEEDIEYSSLPLDTFINGFLNLPYFDPSTFSFVPVVQQRTVEDDAFVPRVSYDWQASEDTFVYASYSEGFKPGGIATTDGNGDISTGEYKPEVLQAYELGMKTAMLDNRLRVEGAVFYNDYTDQQVPFFVTNQAGVSNVSVTNAGESEVQGFELSAAYRPSENWTFSAAYTYADSEYKEFNMSKIGNGNVGTYDRVQSGNVEGDFAGKTFTNSAKNAANVAIRFDKSLDTGLSYFTELAARYQSKRFLDQGNLSYLPEYWLVDFTGGIDYKNWNVVLYVDNLADDDKVKSGLGNVSYGFLAGGQVPAFAANLSLPQPRTIGLRASYSF